MMQVVLAVAMALGIIAMAVIGTIVPIRTRKRIRRMSVTCVGGVAPTCQCDGSCGRSPASNCECVVCKAVWNAPLAIGQAGSVGSTGAITGVHGSSNTVHFNGGNGAITAGGGGGGGGSSVTPGTNVIPRGATGGGMMHRVTPRPPRRGATAGMAGFAEQGSAEFDFAVGTVRGLRQWNLNPPDLNGDPTDAGLTWHPEQMKGATGAYFWQGGVNEAGCNRDRNHKPPLDVDENGTACGCGFWAYWKIGDLATGGAMSVNPNTGLPITGLIEGSGRVLVGERGFRSQRAKIIALAPAFSVQAYAPPRGEDYGAMLRNSLPASDVHTFGYPNEPRTGYEAQQEEAERMQVEAQQRADAWMAVIQDRLGTMYPDARVFATLKGMLASVVTGEMPG